MRSACELFTLVSGKELAGEGESGNEELLAQVDALERELRRETQLFPSAPAAATASRDSGCESRSE